jgi:YidC/Oxa1 family membrane protein insertase
LNEPDRSEQLRMMAFIFLALLIFLLTSHYFKPEPPPPDQKVATAPGPAGGTQATAGPSKPGTSPGTSSGALSGNSGGASGEKAANVPVVQATSEKTIVVESPLLRVELSNRGGVVRSWQTKKYFTDDKPPRPLDLVDQESSQQLGWPFSLKLTDPQLEAEANSGLYVERVYTASAIVDGDPAPPPPDPTQITAPANIAFHWSDGHLDVTKTLKFNRAYEIGIEVSATLDGKPLPVGVAWRGEFGDKAVYKATQLVNVYYNQNDKLNLLAIKKLGVSGSQSQPVELSGPMQYAGIEDQFFTAAFLPDGTDLSVWHWAPNHNIMDDDKPTTELVAQMAAGTAAPGPLRVRAYVGPKDLKLLGQQRPSLEELVQLGWFGVIAKALLLVLQWLHGYVPNYGWCIVVFTLGITMLLFPIRLMTFRSSRKMQSVAPEIKSIQEKYKKYSMSDPRKRKMNEEVMAVYQREGINPLGSCLPMLVQLPFLWAFYRTLQGAIELRHASWSGTWIHDLSARDPYYILPIVMAISSYLMTKMTPMPGTTDPAQQKMLTLMPLMMGFIFFYLSSGLNLYYFTSNLVNVGQQWYLNRTHPLPARGKFKKSKE